jgi:hypothetical protein
MKLISINYLAEVYHCKDTPLSVSGGFGAPLRGQSIAGDIIGQHADADYIKVKAGTSIIKDKLKQLICTDGVGVGKSVQADHGLSLTKNHCTHPDLQGALKDESFPLEIKNRSKYQTCGYSSNTCQCSWHGLGRY